MTLPAIEFLRRFAMHLVPPRFTRIPYYGFLANRVRAANRERARDLLKSLTAPALPCAFMLGIARAPGAYPFCGFARFSAH